jgi:hypothetical protein
VDSFRGERKRWEGGSEGVMRGGRKRWDKEAGKESSNVALHFLCVLAKDYLCLSVCLSVIACVCLPSSL